MKRVFITQSPLRRDKTTGELKQVHDVSPAAKYGSLEVLLPGGPVVLSTFHAQQSLWNKLTGMSQNDYLLCIGDPSVIALASMIAARVTGGIFTLLVWDRHTSEYLPVPVNLNLPARMVAL